MPMKLSYGSGTIVRRTRKNKNGTYVYYQGCIQYEGNRFYVTAKTKVACYAKLRNVKNDIQGKSITKPKAKALTFGEWLTRWYNEYKAPALKPSSLQIISICMNKHVTTKLKKMPIKKINAIDIQECLNTIKYPRQKQETYKVISNALKYAKIDNIVSCNVCENLQKPKHVYKKSRALEPFEQEQLLDVTIGDLHDCILGYLWTGCRRSELLNITREDCDTNKLTIKVRGTKTAKSYRIIPLFEQILPIIQNTQPNECVFKCTQINHKYKAVIDSLGFDNIDIHSLRHTFATNCLNKGVKIKTVQHWLGHSKMSTTTDIYAHLTKTQEAEDIAKMLD